MNRENDSSMKKLGGKIARKVWVSRNSFICLLLLS